MSNEDNVARSLRDTFNLDAEMDSQSSWRSVYPQPHIPIMSTKESRAVVFVSRGLVVSESCDVALCSLLCCCGLLHLLSIPLLVLLSILLLRHRQAHLLLFHFLALAVCLCVCVLSLLCVFYRFTEHSTH